MEQIRLERREKRKRKLSASATITLSKVSEILFGHNWSHLVTIGHTKTNQKSSLKTLKVCQL